MNDEIVSLNPKILWKHFAKLCEIPRPSKSELKVIEYIENFAKKNYLDYKIDEIGNIVVKKEATLGFESRQPVALQSHLDMVPQKNNDKIHDFEKDPIQTIIDGEWVKANGTTLGADNGIGVAAILAILESKEIAHGPIEALFTIDEETGMTGAFHLKPDFLQSKILLNLDTEDENELCIGCAGGVNTTAFFELAKEDVPQNFVAYQVAITGLQGGHSGLDINLGRGNSIKIVFRLVWNLLKNFEVKICNIQGGTVRNAIPREALVSFVVPKHESSYIPSFLEEFFYMVQKELKITEPNFKLGFDEIQIPKYCLTSDCQFKIINSIQGIINGAIRTSDDMPGIVETSTNLAIVSMNETHLEVKCLTRSLIDSAKDDLSYSLQSVFALAGAEVKHSGSYPGWQPNTNSSILKLCEKVHQLQYGKSPHVSVVHAGLECGIISGIYPDIEMVSLGPTIKFPHSPDEKVLIPSVERFWNLLIEILRQMH